MKEDVKAPYKEALKAPWSNQRVNPFIRFLAVVFVLCGVLVFGIAIYFSIIEGVPDKYILRIIISIIGALYFMILFARVAIKGQAPPGWVP